MSRSTFNPENNWKIDEFIEHFDVAYQDLSDMRRYQELMLKSYLSPDEQLELTTITNKQRDKIWMSEDLNVLQDCIVALETFFKDNTIPQLQQFIKDLQAERDSAVGTINAEEAAALAEMQRLMQEYSDTIIGGLHTHSASQITGLARVATTNNYSDLTGLPDISATGHQHTWGQITEKPTSFTPSSHTHDDRYCTEAEMNTKLAAKADNVHNHDDRYYTESEMDVKLNAKSNTGHVHAITDVTGLQGELNGLKQSLANSQSNLATKLVNKGVSANASETLPVLINKVDNIQNVSIGMMNNGSANSEIRMPGTVIFSSRNSGDFTTNATLINITQTLNTATPRLKINGSAGSVWVCNYATTSGGNSTSYWNERTADGKTLYGRLTLFNPNKHMLTLWAESGSTSSEMSIVEIMK